MDGRNGIGGGIMKITVLAENTALSERFTAEHGLSLYIETEGKKILFDMGQTDAFSKNAKELGIYLSKVDFAVLSHGHYDHGGGLPTFLSLNENAPVYLRCHAFGDYFSSKYIGLDKSLENNPRLRFVSDYLKIDENTELFSCNDVKLRCPIESFGLTAEHDGVRTDDDFRHEQYLLIKEKGRRILISGCSHKGVINLAEHFAPDYLIGGFHFMKLDPETGDSKRLDAAAEALDGMKTEFYTCHCTGEAQYDYLKTKMGRLHYISCGAEICI